MKSEYCNLCFAPAEDLLETIKETDWELLAQLEQDLDVNVRNNPEEACTDCLTSLKGYMDFRSSFMQTQACVQSFGMSRSGDLLDLWQVYLRYVGNWSEVVREAMVVCRFCLKQATGAYTPLVDGQVELILVRMMMRKCFPRLELGAMGGHVICIPCHQVLQTSYSFVTSLNVEKRVKDEDDGTDMEFEDGPDLADDCFTFKREDSEGVGVKTERGFEPVGEQEYKPEIRNRDVYDGCKEVVVITVEDIVGDDSLSLFGDDACDVKAEQNASERNQDVYDEDEDDVDVKEEDVDVEEHSLSSFEDDAYDVRELLDASDRFEVYYESEEDIETREEDVDVVEHSLSPLEDETCDVMVERIASKRHKDKGRPRSREMYKCNKCSYETEKRYYLRRHKRIHAKPPRKVRFKCETCSYETRHKNHYNQHTLMHKNPSEIDMHACTICAYKTKRRTHLNRHMLIHKDPSEVTMYKCGGCTYETKYKFLLKRHERSYKHQLKRHVYKCANCTFETRYKQKLIDHMQIHRRDECEACSFATKAKRHHGKHMHKKPGMYKCKRCTYKTPCRQSLVHHRSTHKNLSEKTTYQCKECPFKTMRRYHYDRHGLIHKDATDVTMYKCKKCSYETKRKDSLQLHVRTHKVS